MGTEQGTFTVAKTIGDVEVERIVGPGDAKNVKLSSFWQDQPVIVHVLRRFGCQLCRGAAVEMGKIFPQLEASGVRIVGVGIEKLGLEEFQQGGFWKGELYIDNGKKIHKALDIKSVGILGTVKMLLTNQAVKDGWKKTKDTPGNIKGDGRQLGGTFIFAKGGEMLRDFRQEHFADHLTNVAILEALGLDSSAAKAAAPAEEAVCSDTPGH
ncbi:unnamed protein product [Sphagnum troendelagicum]|uniref:Prostamide/prostaglandin F synthase n=1 Tax=Sphagnum troendelagicum TaxID=128251 RepID=A0ABP0UZM4_9BRYO